MNFKRGKSKRNVKCTMCTNVRWQGNNTGRFKIKDEAKMKDRKEIEDYE